MAAALLVSGCGGGDDGGGESGSDSGGDQTQNPGGGTDDSGSGGSEGEVTSATLQGGWVTDATQNSDEIFVLKVTGEKVIFTGNTTTCHGTMNANAQPVSLTLQCTEGDDYTYGVVKNADDQSLTLSWDSGKSTELRKGGLPSDIPTDVGDIPSIPE